MIYATNLVKYVRCFKTSVTEINNIPKRLSFYLFLTKTRFVASVYHNILWVEICSSKIKRFDSCVVMFFEMFVFIFICLWYILFAFVVIRTCVVCLH